MQDISKQVADPLGELHIHCTIMGQWGQQPPMLHAKIAFHMTVETLVAQRQQAQGCHVNSIGHAEHLCEFLSLLMMSK